MSRSDSGFEMLRAAFERLATPGDLGVPRADAPAVLLGQPLDPDLRAIYSRHDGASWSCLELWFGIYPLDGPDALEWRNQSLRRSGADHVPPYPFDDLFVFAQYGRKASYLVAVPGLADEMGRQPTLYLDAHEEPWALPIASSVDGALAVIGRYLNHVADQFGDGEPGRAGIPEISFPFEVPELIAVDSALRAGVATGAFERWTRGDASTKTWIRSTFGSP